MKTGLFLLLLVISGTIQASFYDDYIKRVVKSCYYDSMLAKQVATVRDNGYSISKVQNIIIKKVEDTEGLTVADLTFGFLMIELVYDRVDTTPSRLQESIYEDCLKMYDIKIYHGD